MLLSRTPSLPKRDRAWKYNLPLQCFSGFSRNFRFVLPRTNHPSRNIPLSGVFRVVLDMKICTDYCVASHPAPMSPCRRSEECVTVLLGRVELNIYGDRAWEKKTRCRVLEQFQAKKKQKQGQPLLLHGGLNFEEVAASCPSLTFTTKACTFYRCNCHLSLSNPLFSPTENLANSRLPAPIALCAERCICYQSSIIHYKISS